MDSNKKRNLNSDLNNCLQSLDSNKITERKVKRQELQQLLEIDEVIEVLNYNSSLQHINKSQSIDGNGYLVTWISLLNCYHRSLILDVENEAKKKQKSGISYKQPNFENCFILLRNIINKANKDQPYLPINDFLKCILDVSQNNTFQLYMGEVYYKILEQSILSQNYYWHSLSSYWNDLFSLAYNLYHENFANMRHVSIKIMKHIVVRGDAHSSVSLAVKKKIFPYLKHAIMDTLKKNNDFSLREDLIILVFGVCKTLWIECRNSLCQFIEENCTHLINFYENDRLKKVQDTLYNLLTLFIKIHHPKCLEFSHKESYAYNENMWIVQLYQIYEFVRREIQQIKNNSNPNFFNYISELSVTIFCTVYLNKLDSSSLDLDECSTPKRKKIYDINLLSFVDDLTNLKTSEMCTRLNIITKLLENHSLPFHDTDYINLLESIIKCLNSYKDTNSTKYLIICCHKLIESDNFCKLNQIGLFFKTLWTYALKTVLSNEISDLSHNLLQSLIVLIDWQDEMYSDILRLYFNKTVKIDDPSLKTLIVLFKTRGFCSASLNKANMMLLLDWLLPLKISDSLIVESFSKLNPYLLFEVVDLILTKPSIKKSFVNHNKFRTTNSNNFTYYNVALQDSPNLQLQFTEPAINKRLRQSIDENIFERLINFIEKNIELKEKASIVTLQCYFSLTNFLCFLENQFPQFNNNFNEFRLYKFKYMEIVNNIVSELKTDVNQLNNEEFINVCLLFHKQFQLIDGIIVNDLMNLNTNKVIMSELYKLSKLNDSNTMYQVLNYDSLTKEQKLSIQAIKALLQTCLYKGEYGNQKRLLETLVEDLNELEASICQSYTYFKITNFLHIAFSLDNLTLDLIIKMNKFIKQLAKSWCSRQEGFIQITQLLSDSLQITTKNKLDKVCTTNLMMLIWSLQKISTTESCGPKMVCAFVDLLGHFASTNNGSFGSTWNIDTNKVQPMSPKNILFYLDSPFFQVRISAIRCMKVICDVYEKNPNTYIISYEEMFDIILHKLQEGFKVDNDISEEEREDEYTNRISTYLLCMQSLITSSVKFRQKCLFEVLQTVYIKKINLDLVINLLECVKIELKMKSYMELLENNLKFLLWEWHLKYSTFKEFPIKLFSCTTIEQFSKKYSLETVPILVIKNDLDILNSIGILCDLIEENFPVIFSYLLAINLVELPFLDHDEIKNLIKNQLGEMHFNELIRFQYSDIILQFIQMVVINTEQPIVPIQISSEQFLILINIFQEAYVKSNSQFFSHMSTKKPNCIQIIVHILYVNIFKTLTSELWYQSFFQYTVFMKALIGQLLDSNQIDEFSYFLINQSVQSIITLLNHKNCEMHYYAIEYLEWLLINPRCIEKLKISQVGSLTSTLRILTKKQHSLKEKLLYLLNILENFSDNVIDCETSIENKTTLHKDINSFLSQQNENTNIVQSLQYLRQKLQTNENELQCMYQELLNMRGFSEDCVKSILHCLICTLIKLTKCDEFEIQNLAASCLGILGPADLTTLILQPEPEVLKLESHISLEYSFIKHIVELVLNYLSDDNVSVLESSNMTLFQIMATNEGKSLYEELGAKTLYPFKHEYSQIVESDVELSFDIQKFNLLIDKNEIWCPIDESISYNNWITNITKHLLETLEGFCKSLLPIAENKPMFCENILPHLVYFLLEYKPFTRPILNKHLNFFFLKHYKMKTEKTSENINGNSYQVYDIIENNIYRNKSAVQCLLSIINFTRLQQNNPLQTILDLNYLYVSQAAQFCSAHFTSIQYLELWCETKFKNVNKVKESMVFNPVDVITEILPEEGLLLQSILNESYKSIGDSDAIEGCGSSYLLNISSRTQYYQQLRKWDRVMENCDLQQTTGVISKDYLEAFSNSGLQNVAHILASKNDSLKYDYCWQLNKWDLPDCGDKSFESLHYHALRHVHLNNLNRAIPIINEARLVVIESLYCASLESTATIYTPLAKLKIIEDLDDFISTSDKNKLFVNWLNQKTLRTNDFENINKILSQRCKLLDFVGDKRSGILRMKIAELAQQNDWLQESGRHLATVATLSIYHKHTTLWAKVEETRLLWKRNDCHMARVLLKCVVEELENCDYPFLYSLALQLYGSWMEETKSETSNDIIKKYFQKSIKKIELESENKEEFGLNYKKVLSDAYKHLSQFTDTLYQQLYKYIKSEDFHKRTLEVEDTIIKGKSLAELGKSTNNKEQQKAGFFLISQSTIDKRDISNKNQEKNKYLRLTLQNYLQLMTLDDESKLPIYRIVSLWLENKENNEINDIVYQGFKNNPSHKFILVLPQLVAHLSSSSEYSFHKSLEKIINRCALDHPFQTIPIVYAVANTNIDHKFNNCEPPDEEESRVLAAKRLMSNWKRDKNISCIVMNTEKLFEAFIQLAYTKFSCSHGQQITIPNEQPLMKIKNSELYMYPAATLPLNKLNDYSNIISIVRFENSFLNCGGVHEPKKIDCLCSDGIQRSLLLKGNEDMHQDAIMQQVFVLMNKLLNSNKSTAKRKLTIRTYKVIPFSQQSGIAEWCENTMSLSNYLTGTDLITGAHQKYRPEDITPAEARIILRSSQTRRDCELTKQKTYFEICKKLKPVFRYYFFEKFLSPSIWFERRQAYIHSVATTSMVGYILGLGDRHVQNILIDNITAELIHIDFGVAFEQGTLLTTPETVPFRLSRDIVDGMGICGIEGSFRKCCEKTMSVLRQNQDVIVTVIEVLLYDPCYQWALTGKKATRLQNQSTIKNSSINDTTEVNKLAERSLNRVRVKLCGMEQAETAAASINGQVNLLIQKARDPNNLALLFHGWQAYL